ncbi:MAG: bifunctional diaminohydroxyphosphoribosylaminopyrimidine deaminase/5-amino-6-(5-phosphoribosylamino)uracil reductase RibD [Gammaproteobacteria bacterium]|nr:bifunctional diaminohydroxyphosphoribosylaminopyrimidine deaminase/5-amino-6-(5-phosphoribosylamino)uracil reductase RibD [Gammaproteobacteria bacterium]
MARALRLAERGRFTAHPNPVVGCVLVRAGEVLGEGWHCKTGEGHAEVNALQNAGGNVRGATAYITLEPCAHHGRTPPCADALVAAGVSRVVAAMVDPSDAVAGRGLQKLRDAGIETSVGLMSSAAANLNQGFIKRVARQRPFVRLKLAMSLDGAIAMSDGESQWITAAESRADVQKLRARSGAVLTGIGTVLADDPSLNVRSDAIDTNGLQPLRVVLDTRLRMSANAKMLSLPGNTLVCHGEPGNDTALRNAGSEVLQVGSGAAGVDIDAVLAELAQREVNDVLVEAGATLAGRLLEGKFVDELVIYQAPHMMGSQTLRVLQTPAWSRLQDRLVLDTKDVRRIGADTRITATIAT